MGFAHQMSQAVFEQRVELHDARYSLKGEVPWVGNVSSQVHLKDISGKEGRPKIVSG